MSGAQSVGQSVAEYLTNWPTERPVGLQSINRWIDDWSVMEARPYFLPRGG